MLDFETVTPTAMLEHREIPAPAMAEPEIVAYHQILHAQPVDQHVGDKLLGRNLRILLVEVDTSASWYNRAQEKRR